MTYYCCGNSISTVYLHVKMNNFGKLRVSLFGASSYLFSRHRLSFFLLPEVIHLYNKRIYYTWTRDSFNSQDTLHPTPVIESGLIYWFFSFRLTNTIHASPHTCEGGGVWVLSPELSANNVVVPITGAI